jgi:hypothetical protein
VGGFLAEFGKKLAERWLSLLVIPGLLYLGTLAAAHTLGHRHPFDIARITGQLDAWTTSPGSTTTSGLVVILLAALLAAAGAGVAAQALGSLTERVWLADRWQSWPPPLRHLAESRTRSRTKRWTTATETYQRQLDTTAAQRARGTETEGDLGNAHRAVSRIAQEQPARPTWVGDRVHAVITRLDREYHLDLPTIWPNLWLAMPETTRTEIIAARQALTRAATLAGWGLLYLAVSALWWPGLLIAVATTGTAWRRARTAADTYALLIEAAARLHTAELARSLGIDHTGPLNQQTGWALTCLLQGQSHLIPLTTGWPTPS